MTGGRLSVTGGGVAVWLANVEFSGVRWVLVLTSGQFSDADCIAAVWLENVEFSGVR
jgi:hypothetical protein